MSVRWSQTRPPLSETLPACIPDFSLSISLSFCPRTGSSLFFQPPIISAPPREAAWTIESNEIPLSRVINIDYNRLYLLGRVEPPSCSVPPGSATLAAVPPRITAFLPTRFASSNATSGATAYLDAHIRCVSAPVILGFHGAALIAIIVTPPRPGCTPQPSRLVVLRSIFPAKASLIDVAENAAIIDFIIGPVTVREKSLKLEREREIRRSLYRKVEIKILMKMIIRP